MKSTAASWKDGMRQRMRQRRERQAVGEAAEPVFVPIRPVAKGDDDWHRRIRRGVDDRTPSQKLLGEPPAWRSALAIKGSTMP